MEGKVIFSVKDARANDGFDVSLKYTSSLKNKLYGKYVSLSILDKDSGTELKKFLYPEELRSLAKGLEQYLDMLNTCKLSSDISD